MGKGMPQELAFQAEVRQLRERIAELERERETARRQSEEENRKLLAAVQEEKDRFAAVIAGISDEIWFADVHKQFTLVNPSAVREFNLAGAYDIGVENLAASLEVYRPDGSPRPIEDAPALRALNGETIRNEEEIIRTPGAGQLRHRMVSSAPVRDASGKTIGSISVVRDITARKRAEEALQKEREWLRVTLNSIGDAVLATDGAGNIVFLNPVAARLTGWTAEEALGRKAQDVFRVVNEQTREMAGDIIERVLTENNVVALANHSALVTRSGGEIPIEDTAAPIRDVAGGVTGVVLVFHDVTAKRRNQEALAAAHAEALNERNRLNALMEALPVGVALIDAHGGTIASNRHFEKVWGGPPPQTLSVADYAGYKAWWTATGQPVQPEEWASARAVQHGETVVNQEMQIQRFDGARAFVLNSAAPILDAQGRIAGSAVAIRDITELKRTEDALKESEAILRSFFDSPGVMRGIAELVDGQIVHVSCNAFAAQVYGVDRESISGRSITEAGGTEEIARMWAGLYEESRRTGEPVSLEYGRPGPHGGQRWLLGTACYLGTGPSGHARFGYTCVDITERKQAEEALRESEQRLEFALETSQTGAWDLDLTDHTAHRSLEHDRIFGYAELLPQWTYEMFLGHVLPEDRMAVDAKFRESMAAESCWSFECRIRRTDGEVRWIWAAGRHRPDAASGHGHLAGIVQDITERKRAEAELRGSRNKYQALIETTSDFIWEMDTQGRYTYCSPQMQTLWGLNADEMIGTTPFDLMPAEHKNRATNAFLANVRSARPFNGLESVAYDSQGRLIHIEINGVPFFGDDGSLLGFRGVTRDVTARKRAEQALRESETRHRLMHETMLQGVVYQNADGEVVSMNATAEKILGWTPEVLGQTSITLERNTIHEDGSAFPGPEHPAMIALRTGETVRDVVMGVYNRLEGGYRWINVQAVPLFRPEENKPYQVYTVFDDITERKRVDGELRRASEQRRLALEAAALGSWDYQFRTGDVYWDERCRNLFGCQSGDRVDYGEAISRIHPDDRAATEEALKEAIAGVRDGVYYREFRVIWPDGSVHWVASHGRVYFEGEGESRRAVRFTGVNMDITERRQSEEHLRHAQKLESLGLLAGGVAHDFNNLLVGVIGNSSLAQEMLPPDHPAAELMETVVKTGEQAAHLTRQMLAYSGKGKFLLEPLDMSALVRDIIELVRPSIPKKVSLKLELDEDLPPIEADRGQVQQILMNLAINAAEAIGSHDGLITVRTGTQVVDDDYLRRHAEAADLQPGRYVVLEVRDTGSGMDGAVKAKIFDPFFSTKFTGRGLGLAAVAGIVRGHKGAIVVTSAPGKGTTFEVLFPPALHPADRRPNVVPSALLQGSGVVLVIDDERVVRGMAKKALERHGYTVLVADGALAAIDILKRYPGKIDLAVLDLSMPGMSGEEALPELRKIRPEMKVFVSSGYSEAEAMTLFRGQPVSGFVQKPYTSTVIAEKVKRALG